MKRLLLLGGGHAHVHVLDALAREPLPATEVVMVTPFNRQVYSGMVPGLVAGHYTDTQCAIALEPLCRRAGVRLMQAAVSEMDATRRQVSLADGQALAFDVASLDVGSTMDRNAIPGAREHALWVRPIELFARWAQDMLDVAAQRALDVVVVGAGAAGVELALALQYRMSRPGMPGCRVSLVAGPAGPLAGYPARVVNLGLRALRRARVVVFNENCVEVGADHVHLGNGARLACDAPLMCLGGTAQPWVARSGLQVCDKGFVQTSAALQSLSHPHVFAAGDVAMRPDLAHPRSGVFAVRAGPPLALNLRRYLADGQLVAHQPRVNTLNLISCGGRSAIMSWGRWSVAGPWAWWWKDQIDRAFIKRYSPDIVSS